MRLTKAGFAFTKNNLTAANNPMHDVNWHYPTAIRNGAGRVSEIAAICKQLWLQTPLLVTDPGLAQLPMVRRIIALCSDAGLGIKLFSDIKSNPTGDNVNRGIAQYHASNHDGVIAMGGGSGLDAGKAIAAGQACDIWELEDIGDNWLQIDAAKIPPIIAIPTTAGTGAEVGRAAVIVAQTEQRKVIIFHPKMLPDYVILDPELTLALPAGLTARRRHGRAVA